MDKTSHHTRIQRLPNISINKGKIYNREFNNEIIISWLPINRIRLSKKVIQKDFTIELSINSTANYKLLTKENKLYISLLQHNKRKIYQGAIGIRNIYHFIMDEDFRVILRNEEYKKDIIKVNKTEEYRYIIKQLMLEIILEGKKIEKNKFNIETELIEDKWEMWLTVLDESNIMKILFLDSDKSIDNLSKRWSDVLKEENKSKKINICNLEFSKFSSTIQLVNYNRLIYSLHKLSNLYFTGIGLYKRENSNGKDCSIAECWNINLLNSKELELDQFYKGKTLIPNTFINFRDISKLIKKV